MAIEHVEYGKEAEPDDQNALIDLANLHTTQISVLDLAIASLELLIAAKPDLCSDLPQDTSDAAAVGSSGEASPCDHVHKAVGSADPLAPTDTAAPGTETLASREDHVHPAVSQIIAGSGVTLDPASGLGAVTISAAAAGGGVTKVEKTFDGTFSAGDEIVSDTPTSDKLLVAAYVELTTTNTLLLAAYFNNKACTADNWLVNAGDYFWILLTQYLKYSSDDSLAGGARPDNAWKLGYKVAVKCEGAGTGSGKLIIYYAAIT